MEGLPTSIIDIAVNRSYLYCWCSHQNHYPKSVSLLLLPPSDILVTLSSSFAQAKLTSTNKSSSFIVPSLKICLISFLMLIVLDLYAVYEKTWRTNSPHQKLLLLLLPYSRLFFKATHLKNNFLIGVLCELYLYFTFHWGFEPSCLYIFHPSSSTQSH